MTLEKKIIIRNHPDTIYLDGLYIDKFIKATIIILKHLNTIHMDGKKEIDDYEL